MRVALTASAGAGGGAGRGAGDGADQGDVDDRGPGHRLGFRRAEPAAGAVGGGMCGWVGAGGGGWGIQLGWVGGLAVVAVMGGRGLSRGGWVGSG